MRQSDLPNITRSRKPRSVWITALTAGVIAAALAITITRPPGPGLDPDSASYLGAAESLVHGRGYRIPIADWATLDSTSALTHFPPGYSTAIAIPLLLGTSPLSAARVVDAIAAFVDVALMVWLVATVAGLITAVALALAVLVMPAFMELHLSVLSEPLFLAFMMGALVAMVSQSEPASERRQLRRAFLAGVAAAAAMLVRYIGAAVIAAVALWMLLQPVPWTARARRVGAAALPAILLVGAWVFRVHLTSGAHAIRTFAAYGGLADAFSDGASTIVAWLVPLMSDQTLPGRTWIALVMIVALVFLLVVGARIARHSTAGSTIAAALIVAVCYAIVLVGSRWLADPGIPFDSRLLSPLFVLTTIAAAVAIRVWWREARVAFRVLASVVLIVWFAASITVSLDEVTWVLEFGQDFAQAQWTSSPLLAWARANASNRPLYSNWPPAVFFHLHRSSHELPARSDERILRALADTIRARHGVILVFDQPSPDQLNGDVLLKAPGFRSIARVSDGTVLTAAP